jgi:type I restriction enzyme R subunit
VLFLVDRSALGEQAANAFKDTRMESLQTFAEVFGIKELDEQPPDSDTAVHIATVQGMVQRVLYTGEDSTPPPSIVTTASSSTSATAATCSTASSPTPNWLPQLRRLHLEVPARARLFRCHEDRPHRHAGAAHDADLRRPIYTYGYREAVIDGYLVDHEPPVQITTELSSNGIVWKAGERYRSTTRARNEIDLFTTPDEIKLESRTSTARSSPSRSIAWSASTWRANWTPPHARRR